MSSSAMSGNLFRTPTVLVGTCALCAILVIACPAAADPAPESNSGTTDPWALYRRGYDAMQADDWDGAYVLLRRAWTLKASGEIAGLLGQVELQWCKRQTSPTWCDKYIDAAHHFAFALRNVSASSREKADSRARVEELLSEAKKHVVTLKIQGPQGAEIFVNDVPVGTAPLADAVFVKPGAYRIEARQQGVVIATVSATASSGEERSVTLLRSTGAPTKTRSDQAPSTPPAGNGFGESSRNHERSMTPAYVLGGVAVASAGTALALGLSAASDETKFNQHRSQIAPGACAGGIEHTADCNALSDELGSHNSKVTASRIFYGLGAAAGAAAIVYTFWASSSHSKATAQVGFYPGGGSLRLSGTF